MLQPVEILMVEDYEPDAYLFQLMLRRNHISNKLRVFEDGQAVLDFVFGRGNYKERNSGQFSGVIIMDIRLPKVDGWEVLRQLREDSHTHELPVIITSGMMLEEEQERAMRLGATACLAKPIQFEALQAVLNKCGFVWSITETEAV